MIVTTEDIETQSGDGTLARRIEGVAEILSRRYIIARDSYRKLYVFQHGVFLPGAEGLIEDAYLVLLKRLQLGNTWKSRTSEEVVRYFKSSTKLEIPIIRGLPKPPNVWYLNVLNGMINIRTRELLPHDPKYLSTIQIPVNYDPAMNCNNWDEFIKDVFPADAQLVPWELIAWLMVPCTSIQKVALLYGQGANGKSIFLNALQTFLGDDNVVNIPLQDLEYDRFATARLIGKLANIYSDLPDLKLRTTGKLKALASGGDRVRTEDKFRESGNTPIFARHVFATNQLPKVNDTSHGFYRRMHIIPMPNSFEENPKEHNCLMAGLTNHTQLSGALNKALDMLPRVLSWGLSESPSMRLESKAFKESNMPPAVRWLMRNTEKCDNGWVTRQTLYAAYENYTLSNEEPLLSRESFYSMVEKSFKVAKKTRKISREVVRGFAGLRLTEQALG